MKYFLGLSSNFSVGDTLRHTFAIGNEYHLSELRAFLAAHYGATYDHVAVYSNGRTALNAAIKATVKRGSKVVITSLTCYAVVQAVKSAGCVPVFADVDKNTLHFGAKELEAAIKGETEVRAIIIQNNLGIPADIEAIEKVAEKHKLVIIEDLAHCAGVRYSDGREAGTVGRACALSFGKGKSIDAVTGGAVVFTNPLDPPVKQPENPPKFKANFCARFYPLFSAIIRGGYDINKRLGQILQGGLVKIGAIRRSADGVVDPKTRLTLWQCKLALRQLQGLPHQGRPPLREHLLVYNRNDVLTELENKGYYFRDIWYDLPVAPKRYFRKADFHPELCPVANQLAEQIINFPTWYEEEELKEARKVINHYLVDRPEGVEEETEEESTKEREEDNKKSKKSKRSGKKLLGLLSKKTQKPTFWKDRRANVDDGAPDDEVDDDRDDKKKSFKERFKKNKDDEEDNGDSDYYDPTVSVLEQSSGLLAAEKRKEAIKKNIAESKKDLEAFVKESPQQPDEVKDQPKSKKTVKSVSRPEAKARPPKKETSMKQKTVILKAGDNDLSGMRVAPKKLTERERIKLEMESGEKGTPSVL